MAKVELQNIIKYYNNNFCAIKGINLTINEGEFIVFVGPSGCGKSTLLRMIAGLEEITEGTLLFDQKIMNFVLPGKRGISMVFQNYALYPHMNVYDNMAFGLRNTGCSEDEVEDRINYASKQLHMHHLLRSKPKELSGGQQQRVALGRSIVRQPRVFLFDEPLSNLDAALRQEMQTEILLLHQKLHATMIYVTHDQTEAMIMADRIVVIKDGAVEQIGTPMEIYRKPVNVFVAGFIGTPKINIISCTYNESNFKILVDDNVSINFKPNITLKENKLYIGIRPNYINIVKKGKNNFGSAIVKIIEQLGDETIVHAKRDNNQDVIIKLQHTTNIKIGDLVYLDIDLNNLHIFNSDGYNIAYSSRS